MSQADRRIEALEKEVRWLRRQLANVPIRVTPGGGGGGNLSVIAVPTRADLPSDASNGAFAYTTAETPCRGFMRVGDEWFGITHSLTASEVI